ncbi:MAG: hypothetical protein JSS02_29130, partial [Planctomycetes bacterium]|nr:hypothetical protein [Planctomycetota bacterium]
MLRINWNKIVRLAFRASLTKRQRPNRRSIWGNSSNLAASVESLEGRQLLSVITVTTDSDLANHTGVSLRDAITQSNASGVGDTIVFSTDLSGKTILLTQGEIKITAPVAIDATAGGATGITISGNTNSRIFYIRTELINPITVSISNLTLQNGNGVDPSGAHLANDGQGGAIFNHERLYLL